MRISVLDHGYVEFIESWGHGKDGEVLNEDYARVRHDCEAGIIEAARQSTQGSFRGWETDAHLLKTLSDNKHATPFEFAGMVIEVQAPIMVFREWHRHRTQSYNEMSARYAPLPDLYYEPSVDHVLGRAIKARDERNRQAGAATGAQFDQARIDAWVENDQRLSVVLEANYQEGLACGVPKELARKKMPVDHYSRMRAAANLRNWLSFLTLRMDPMAQYEIRQYARAVGSIIAVTFPQTWALFAAPESA